MMAQKQNNTMGRSNTAGGVWANVKAKRGAACIDGSLSVYLDVWGSRHAPDLEKICLFGMSHDDTCVALQVFKPKSVVPVKHRCDALSLSDVDVNGANTTVLLVNVDTLGDVEDAVDELIAFRKQFPAVIVMMVSACVLGDDFGTYRQLICDATLRSPISQTRLENGLAVAMENNLHRLPQIRSAA